MYRLKTIQIIKKVNNTEVGKGGTHETYILVPQELDVSEFFPIANQKIEFYDPIKNASEEIRLTIGREKRIVGLGPFYRKYDASAGDEIILQKAIANNATTYKIYCKKHQNSLIIQKVRDGFEILTPERMSLINETTKTRVTVGYASIALQFQASIKKRTDSPETTDIYSLMINGEDRSSYYSSGTTLEIIINENLATVFTPIAWKKQIIETEDDNQ